MQVNRHPAIPRLISAGVGSETRGGEIVVMRLCRGAVTLNGGLIMSAY